MPKVLICVTDGSEDIEFSTPVDLLHGAGNEITIAKVGGDISNNQCKLAHGLNIIADVHFNDISDQKFDCIVTPGGLPGAFTLGSESALIQMIKQHKEDGKLIACICASPATVLGANGLLEGFNATCYPAKDFQEKIPNLVNQRVVVDRNIITSQGPATSTEFALTIVKYLHGEEFAKQMADGILYQGNLP